jgi:hypothetical protein
MQGAFANVDIWAGDTMPYDRNTLVHVREVVFLETELAVLVQHEVDRLAVVLNHEL